MKRCFKCQSVKPLNEFYRHPEMSDGRLNKCKQCARADVQKNYRKNHSYYAEYDRQRQQRAERRAAKMKYQSEYRKANPDKYKAHCAVNNAVRDSRLIKQPCKHCGSTEDVQGHHFDYSKPLDVVWVCFNCHRELEHGQTVAA
jgi:hypothetical protein